jgi:hypothetical protein
MTAPDGADPYFQAIEEAFNRRRGAPLLLSPRDWALIDSWQRARIPLRIVLQGIENAFDAWARRPPTARRINSLSYCRQEVLSLHELYLGLHGAEAARPDGAAPVDPARALSRHLGRLSRRVKEAMAAASADGRDALVGPLAEAAAEIKRMRKHLRSAPPDPLAIERALEERDRLLLAAARAALPPPSVAAAESEAEAALAASAPRMTAEGHAATRRVAVDRLLRRAAGLPRLSLFD